MPKKISESSRFRDLSSAEKHEMMGNAILETEKSHRL